MAAQNSIPRPKPKIDRTTLIVYIIISAFLLFFSLLLGAALDYSVSASGKIQTDQIGNAFSYLTVNPSKIFEAVSWGGYASKLLHLSIMGIGIFVLYVFGRESKRLHRRGTEYGSARWGDKKEMRSMADRKKPFSQPLKKYDAEHPEGVRLFDRKGRFLCATIDNNLILTKDVRMSMDPLINPKNFNILACGGSGSMKTRGLAKPNVMQLNTSYVITDPKGEILAAEGELLRSAGYKVRVFNTIEMAHSNNYNPFHYVFDNNGQIEEVKVKSMVGMLFNTTKGDGEKEDFWAQKGQSLIKSIVYLLLAESEYHAQRYKEGEKKGMVIPETRDESHLNFYSVAAKLLRMKYPPQGSQQPDGFFLKQNPGESDAAFEARREKAFLSDLDRDILELRRHDIPIARLAYDTYCELRNAPEETGQSIIASANVKVSDFNLTGLKNLTCCDNIHLETLGDEKTALFIVISATNQTFHYLAAMLYSQLFDVLSNRANFKYHGKLPVHVRCIMDEFANIGEIPDFNSIVSFVRGMNMSLTVIIQNMSQLKSRYEKTWEEIPGNCDSILFLGGKEESTLKSISEQLGKETIDIRGHNRTKGKTPSTSENNSIIGRELLQANEIASIPTTDCILMIRGHNPFYCKKFVLEQHPNYRFTGDADKAFAFDISKLHTVTLEEFEAEQQKTQRQYAEKPKQETIAEEGDTRVTPEYEEVKQETAKPFFSSADDQIIAHPIPTTYEELHDLIMLTNPVFSPEIEETFSDDEPHYGTEIGPYSSYDLGGSSEQKEVIYDDTETIPESAAVNTDEGSDELEPESVIHYDGDAPLPHELQSYDDLSELSERIRFVGQFIETLADAPDSETEYVDYADSIM